MLNPSQFCHNLTAINIRYILTIAKCADFSLNFSYFYGLGTRVMINDVQINRMMTTKKWTAQSTTKSAILDFG